ncbi:MAG: cytochrome P450 [Candidatus Nitrosocosmicus sp.]
MALPPGPTEIIPYILALKFISNPIPILMEIANKYGDISHFKFGPTLHVYLVNNAYHIENILVKYNSNFIKSPGLRLAKRVLGNGLITNEGSAHKTQRQLVQPAFSRSRVKICGKIILEHCLEYVDNTWKDSMVSDIHKEMTNMTISIISIILFGTNALAKSEIDKISNSITTIIEYINRLRLPFLRFIEVLPLPLTIRYRQALRSLDRLIYAKIEERKETAESRQIYENNSLSGGTAESQSMGYFDMLSILIKSSDIEITENNEEATTNNDKAVKMTNQQLRDEVMTIFLAGHETTANALTWSFYLLSQHPEVESKITGEIASVFGNDGNTDDDGDRMATTFEDVSKLKYTEMVLMESMRLYPPSWAIGHQAIKDYALDSRYVIPSGSVIIMSQYLMHHDSRYFSQPWRFYPERWSHEFRSSIPRFSYFPFGGGPRSCIGEPLAWTEGIIILETILRKWKITLEENAQTVKLQPIVTLRPKNGIRMKLHRR